MANVIIMRACTSHVLHEISTSIGLHIVSCSYENLMKYLTVRKFIIRIIVISACLLCLPPCYGHTQEIILTHALITRNAGQVLVYAQATGCFTKETKARILAGVPITLIFYLDLYQQRSYWWDKRLARFLIKNTIKYDNVENNFFVSTTNGKQESVTFQTFEAAQRAMIDLSGVAVLPVRTLAKDKSYYLKMKAKQEDRPHLPLHMEYLSFFSSLWDIGPGWQKQEISYKDLMAP